MDTWFEVKITSDEMTDKGISKPVTRSFLVNAMSFTEAEARIIEERTPYVSGELKVAAMKRTNYREIFPNEGDDTKWYAVKAAFITIDERSGKEKRQNTLFMAEAGDIEDARSNFNKGMEGTMADYDIIAINETKIEEVYGVKLGNLAKSE